MTEPVDDLPATVADFAAVAAQRLAPGPYGYYAGGAGDELTLADNAHAWSRLTLSPRVLVDVSERDPSVTLLGRRRPHPLVVAPMAFQRLAHPDGEAALARAAAATGTTYCLSTLATTSVTELAQQVPEANRWFQLYVFRDRAVSRAMVAAAAEAGYEALVVTVDLPLFGHRDRDLRTGFQIPATASVPIADAAGASGSLSPAEFAGLIDPSLTWDDIEDFAATAGLPVVVKGILRPDDARHAVEAGAAAVVVSNHGGRQLDTVRAGADALPAVVDAIGGDADVLVDGGVRRGTDIVKALALGANGVLVGRAVLWGLAVAGTAGAQRVLELLLAEFDLALALCGVPRAADVGRDVLD